MKIVQYLSRFLRLVLFLLLLAFAVKNTEPVTLHFFLGQSWQMPLALLVFLFFLLGVMLAFLACSTRLFRDKREIQTLKRKLEAQDNLSASGAAPELTTLPPPDAIL